MTGALEAVRHRAYLKDYDVEVAALSGTCDPLVDVAVEGVRANVRVDPTPDGRFLVVVDLQASALDEEFRTRRFDFGAGPAGVELPAGSLATGSLSAALQAGGGILFGTTGKEESTVWLVCLETVSGAGPEDADGALLLDVGALGLPLRRTPRALLMGPNPSGFGAGFGLFDDLDPSWPRLDLPTALLAAAGLGQERPGEETLLIGGKLVCRVADDARRAGIRERVARLSRGLLRNLQLDIRFGLLDAKAARGVLRRLREDPAADPDLPQSLRTVGLPGDLGSLADGGFLTYLKDLDTEIAPQTTMGDPIVDILHHGIEASLELRPALGDRVRVRGDVRFVVVDRELREVPAGRADVPSLELPSDRACRAGLDLLAEKDTWALVARADVGEEGQVAVIALKVSERAP